MERSLLNRYTDTVREKVLSLQEKLFSGRKSSRSLRAEGLTDYGCAELSLKQRASYYAAAAGALFFLGMLFYRSAAASLLLMVFSLPLEKVYRAALVEKVSINRSDFLIIERSLGDFFLAF